MAMSARFSFTTMTSAATILKAATATTSSRITNSIDLVISMERKKLAWIARPVADVVAAAQAHAPDRAPRAAPGTDRVSARRTPLTLSPIW